ncbi:MAG TPA: hypothetical protein VFS05_10265 [Gemmatimonadaceae bacterium]|nr:hypothetical protein [Gemmatimonadaceae bacterium]
MDRSLARQFRVPVVLAAVAAVALIDAGCRREARRADTTKAAGTESTSASSPDTVLVAEDTTHPWSGPIEMQPHKDVIQFAHRFEYDSTREPGDSVLLRYKGMRGPGARIFRNRKNPSANSAILKKGWFVGIVVVAPGDSFPPFGIRSETTYVWVDGTKGTQRGLWIPGRVKSGEENQPAKQFAAEVSAGEHTHSAAAAVAPAPDEWPPVALAAIRRTALLQPRVQTKQWTFDKDSLTSQGCWQTSTTWLRTPNVQ